MSALGQKQTFSSGGLDVRVVPSTDVANSCRLRFSNGFIAMSTGIRWPSTRAAGRRPRDPLRFRSRRVFHSIVVWWRSVSVVGVRRRIFGVIFIRNARVLSFRNGSADIIADRGRIMANCGRVRVHGWRQIIAVGRRICVGHQVAISTVITSPVAHVRDQSDPDACVAHRRRRRGCADRRRAQPRNTYNRRGNE